jgi:hypothetical protein
MDVKKPNRIAIHLKCKKDFKLKKLVVDVNDVKGIYDLHGNMMHENKAEFYIKNYIEYSKKTQNLMGGLGAVCKNFQILSILIFDSRSCCRGSSRRGGHLLIYRQCPQCRVMYGCFVGPFRNFAIFDFSDVLEYGNSTCTSRLH